MVRDGRNALVRRKVDVEGRKRDVGVKELGIAERERFVEKTINAIKESGREEEERGEMGE